jgi:hypothetical protein
VNLLRVPKVLVTNRRLGECHDWVSSGDVSVLEQQTLLCWLKKRIVVVHEIKSDSLNDTGYSHVNCTSCCNSTYTIPKLKN